MNTFYNGEDTVLREEVELFKSNGKYANPKNTKRKIKEKTHIQKKSQPEKFDEQLNEEQKFAKKLILDNDIIALIGKAGSGKTFLSCQAALDAIFRKEVEKIYITRPMVSKEDMGHLPGGVKEKMDPWLKPIYENLKILCKSPDKRLKLEKMIEEEDIEISPISFMRGRTKKNSYIIVDECQNITKEQMLMILTRLGKGSKLIFCGDSNQVDLKKKSDSGLNYLLQLGRGIEGFEVFELKKNHRHPIVDKFIDKVGGEYLT